MNSVLRREGNGSGSLGIRTYKSCNKIMYANEERLDLTNRIGVTKAIYEILKVQKKKLKISMAKIVCNLVLEKYENQHAQEGIPRK